MPEQNLYRSVVYLQNEAAETVFRLLDSGGPNAALGYLREFETEGNEILASSNTEAWGRRDTLIELGDFVIAMNRKLRYVSLARKTNLRS
ncbi:MAG TPA: hypothetical protein VI136_27015 [Verrucomicrobiae bacterium]